MTVYLIIETATKQLLSGSIYNINTLDKGMTYIPGGTEIDGGKFYQLTQNGTNLKLMIC